MPPPTASAATATRAGRIRTTVVAWAWCALGGGGVYVLRDRTAAAAGLAAAVLMAVCAAVVLVAVLFGAGEHRSPFVRFMLLVCVLIGRPPGEYLPPGPGERRHGESRYQQAKRRDGRQTAPVSGRGGGRPGRRR